MAAFLIDLRAVALVRRGKEGKEGGGRMKEIERVGGDHGGSVRRKRKEVNRRRKL